MLFSIALRLLNMNSNQSMFLSCFFNFVLNYSFECQRSLCESCRSYHKFPVEVFLNFILRNRTPYAEDFHFFKINLTRITVTHNSLICLFLSHCFPVGKILPVKPPSRISNSNMCNYQNWTGVILPLFLNCSWIFEKYLNKDSVTVAVFWSCYFDKNTICRCRGCWQILPSFSNHWILTNVFSLISKYWEEKNASVPYL